jgi:hypothetical protein
VTAERALGKDELALHRHLEHPAGGRHQADLRLWVQLLQLSRQTGGSRLVISDDAILDDDAHALPRSRVGRIVASLRDPAKGPRTVGLRELEECAVSNLAGLRGGQTIRRRSNCSAGGVRREDPELDYGRIGMGLLAGVVVPLPS